MRDTTDPRGNLTEAESTGQPGREQNVEEQATASVFIPLASPASDHSAATLHSDGVKRGCAAPAATNSTNSVPPPMLITALAVSSHTRR